MILLVRFDADFASFFKNKIIHFRKISKKLVFPEITPFHSLPFRQDALCKRRRCSTRPFEGILKTKKLPQELF